MKLDQNEILSLLFLSTSFEKEINMKEINEFLDIYAKNGDHDDAWEYFKANGISAYTYGCEEIIDECGTKYYGVYYGNMDGEKYYY